MLQKEVLILVKTYPCISKSYCELVCTAGLTREGKWIRLYPIAFRGLDPEQQYKKFEWITVNVQENPKDNRPESYRVDEDSIQVGNKIDSNHWDERRKLVLDNGPGIYTNLTKLIEEAKNPNKRTSLAIFKPSKFKDFIVSSQPPKYTDEEWENIREIMSQTDLFGKQRYSPVERLPFEFSYCFEDEEGRESTLVITDWEICQLYRNCFNRCQSEEQAKEMVRKKYWDDYVNKKDVYLFLGTTLKYHNIAKNPFIIIGVFAPPKQTEKQLPLF